MPHIDLQSGAIQLSAVQGGHRRLQKDGGSGNTNPCPRASTCIPLMTSTWLLQQVLQGPLRVVVEVCETLDP